MDQSEKDIPIDTESTHPSSLLNFLEVTIRWRRWIIINVIIVAVLSSGISLLLPNYFKSTASILPPKQQDIFGSAMGATSLLKGLTGGKSIGSLGKNTGIYNYLAILKSRTSMVSVINKFDLLSVYDIKKDDFDKAIKQLEDNTLFEVQDDDNITIEVFDKEPQRAADMANYFVELLNITSINLGTQEAKNNREFIEKRLDQCRTELKNAEDALREYQEKKEIFISDDAKNSSLTAYSELYALKAKTEIEIAVLERSVDKNNQLLRQLQYELDEITKKVSAFPAAGLEGIRLYREVMIQNKILEFLLPLFEQARIDEQKDIPVLLVIDNAVPATRKSKPQRSIIVVLFTFLMLILSLVFAAIFYRIEEYSEKSNPIAIKLKKMVFKISTLYRIKTNIASI